MIKSVQHSSKSFFLVACMLNVRIRKLKKEDLHVSQTFDQFQALYSRIRHLNRATTLMSWDLYTATPKNGYQDMSDTLTYFSSEAFSLSTSEEFLSLLEALSQPEEFDALSEGMQYTVKTLKTQLEKERRIPKDFFEELISLQSASMQAWGEAKRAADFSIFAPYLEKLIDRITRRCAYTDPGKDTYEVLLDQYEKGMDSASIDRVFSELKEGLLPLLDQILSAPQPDDSIFKGYYDPNAQKKVQELLLSYIGFSLESGTVAESEHPFTLGFSKNDVRVTNHFLPDDPLSAMFSAIHEGGHGIFEQNVDSALQNTAADDCPYMGVHESQSRFFENVLGRNRNFWLPVYPQIQELLPELKRISLDDFVREINHVRNSFIRTDADEVTYPLHIIIRYEIEQAIFRDHVPVAHLPELWNQKMQQYLHITPANDAEGILQDMHWSDGSFGYFPSYLLGSIYDGMFLQAIERDLGSIDDLLATGKIQNITHWLNKKIHHYGGLRLPKEVLHEVCHEELSAQPLLTYFREKYTELYNL